MKVIEESYNLKRKPIFLWSEDIEDGALEQAKNIADLPFAYHHIALMPDVHQGYGMPIGGVMATRNVIVPNAVGVDIGCGMVAVKTNIGVEGIFHYQVEQIFKRLKREIPVGFNVHPVDQAWQEFDDFVDPFGICKDGLPNWLHDKKWDRIKKGLGTLGGGNHFVELQKGDDGYLWLMIHSGSRYLGKIVADYYHKEALLLNQKWYSNIPNKDLAFLPFDSQEGQDYLRDMNFALRFARENRKRMMIVFKGIVDMVVGNVVVKEEIDVHHNYANLEHHYGKNVWIHRKGATSAKDGEKGIIPGSMGTSSYIVEGLGNPLSFCSCSHGAGRKMGRIDASRRLNKVECDKSMDGIVFDGWGKGRKTKYDLGEAPGAYKNIDEVMENQSDLVKIITKLSPLGVLKG